MKKKEEIKEDLKRIEVMKIKIKQENNKLEENIDELNKLKEKIQKEEIDLIKMDHKLLEKSGNSEMPILEEGKVKPFNILKKIGIFNKFRDKLNPSKSFLITMRFSNGTEKSWCITTTKEIFYYKKKGYYLRFEDNIFDLSSHRYRLYFHEDYIVPFDRDPAVILNPNSQDPRNFLKLVPHNLKKFIDMEYIKALAEAVEISKYFRLIIILLVISLFIGIILLYGAMRTLGVF